MKIIVGLGNPGKEYENTRHNVGFMVVDRLAEGMENGEWRMEKKFNAEIFRANNVLLAKPQGYMNKSGEVVKKLMAHGKWQIDDLYVIHDDLDIKLGEYKIQLGKGPKVHNGVKSIEQHLKTKDFWRIRIGIDDNDVLGKFTQEEKLIVDKVVDEVSAAIVERL